MVAFAYVYFEEQNEVYRTKMANLWFKSVLLITISRMKHFIQNFVIHLMDIFRFWLVFAYVIKY